MMPDLCLLNAKKNSLIYYITTLKKLKQSPYYQHSFNQLVRKIMDVMDRIKDAVENNPVVIFMKGTPQLPQCGFSSRAAQALQGCGEDFAYVNVLTDPEIFQNLPQYANWPTFPQVYINGELIGGCDITLEMFEKGELQTMVKEASAKAKSEDS